MGIVKDYLDPNAAAYADLADLDSAAATKLAGIDAGAEVNPTPTEVKDGIVALPDDEREIIISRPIAGQFKDYAMQRQPDGTHEIERSDTAES